MGPSIKPPRRSRRWLVWVVLIVVGILAVGIASYFLITKLTAPKNNTTATEKVLTVNDLDNHVEVSSGTSDASVDNLTKELEAKIDAQVAAKENPIATVTRLIDVLCTTANTSRPMQCIDYITKFLDTKMDTLKLKSDEYGQPDDLQVTYWRAQFYVQLANNYKLITDNNFADSDGKPLGTTADQLKYVKLYLDIAQNRANWGEPQTSSYDGHTWYLYSYSATDRFVEWRKELEARGAS